MRISFIASIVAMLAFLAFDAHAASPLQLTIKGYIERQSNPNGHCGASESGLIFEGTVIAVNGKAAKGIRYDDCGESIADNLQASANLEVVSDFAQARKAKILQNAMIAQNLNQALILTIDQPVITKEGFAYGGTLVKVETENQ